MAPHDDLDRMVRLAGEAVLDARPATISLIWTILYPVIIASFGFVFVFVQAFRRKVPPKVALPFAVNLVANLLFMPIFAGLRSVPTWQESHAPVRFWANHPVFSWAMDSTFATAEADQEVRLL
jgi:hypothetical protein